MNTVQKPTHYTTEEGGTWKLWPFGYLNTNALDTHIKDLVGLSVLPIVSIKFNDTSIWDVGIGWRTLSIKGDFLDTEVEVDKCTCDSDPREIACNTCLKELKGIPGLGDSLNEAHAIINGERQNSYGNPEDSFATIAEYWNVYMIARPTTLDEGALTALDVAHMMMLFKLARCSGQQTKRDNYIDIQGYAAIAADRLVKE
jgi:hypothetical protein